MEEDFFLAEMAWLSEVGSYFGGPLWGEGDDGALMLREMEMGVVVWDFFRAGGTPPLGEEVWEDFLEGLPSAGNRFSSYFCYIGLLHGPPYTFRRFSSFEYFRPQVMNALSLGIYGAIVELMEKRSKDFNPLDSV